MLKNQLKRLGILLIPFILVILISALTGDAVCIPDENGNPEC